MQDGDERRVPAREKRTDSDRRADLVPGQGKRVETAGGEVDRQLADGLDGVAVHRDAVLVGDRDDLGDRLDGADLVVGPHHGDERDGFRVAVQRRVERVEPDAAEAVDRQPLDLGALVAGQPLQGVEHRVVLDAAGDDAAAPWIGLPAAPVEALDREVVGLGAAGGEDDLGGLGAECGGDLLARLLDEQPGGPARRVQRRRVAGLAQTLDATAATASGSIGVVAAWSR